MSDIAVVLDTLIARLAQLRELGITRLKVGEFEFELAPGYAGWSMPTTTVSSPAVFSDVPADEDPLTYGGRGVPGYRKPNRTI